MIDKSKKTVIGVSVLGLIATTLPLASSALTPTDESYTIKPIDENTAVAPTKALKGGVTMYFQSDPFP